MFLYIHGFRTTTNTYTSKLIKEYFKEYIFISDHPIEPRQAIKYMENIIHKKDIRGIIASSLGGFYATFLSEKYKLKTVLINPSIKPYKTLKKHIGTNRKFNKKPFIWKKRYLEELKLYKIQKPSIKNYLLLLQKGDNILDYTVAFDFYKGSSIIIEENGSHKFENLDRHFKTIEKFLKSSI